MSIKQGGNTIAGAVGKYPLNERNISNCITEIPQDIKLELTNGTLTLKAGSKVYVPNGFESDGTTPKFDIIAITNDISISFTNANTYDNIMICLKSDGTASTYFKWVPNDVGSGTTPVQYSFYYRTNLNKLYDYEADTTTPYEQLSLPICICSFSNNAITSINQVFNGFGYIGSTVFALPGVKGLIPNGRNADGSLKNTTTNDFTTVKTVQVNTSTAKIAMYSGGGLGSQTKNFGLNEPENYNYDSGILTNALEVASVIVNSSAKITSFEPKTAFHAVNYSDTEYIAHQAMPSNRYNSLTVGASGTTYTAPADGWFYISAKTSGTNYQVIMAAGYMSVSFRSSSLNQRIILPVSKGMVMNLNYDGTLSDTTFRFIYAEGAQ